MYFLNLFCLLFQPGYILFFSLCHQQYQFSPHSALKKKAPEKASCSFYFQVCLCENLFESGLARPTSKPFALQQRLEVSQNQTDVLRKLEKSSGPQQSAGRQMIKHTSLRTTTRKIKDSHLHYVAFCRTAYAFFSSGSSFLLPSRVCAIPAVSLHEKAEARNKATSTCREQGRLR